MSREPVLIHGWHAVAGVLETGPERILELWVEKGRSDPRAMELLQNAENIGVTVQKVDSKRLDTLAQDGNHQGVLARARPRPEQGEKALWRILEMEPVPLILVLDEIQDPHNLGACLRSADGAGAHAVVVPGHRAAGLTPAVRKVAAGAGETVPFIRAGNLARCLHRLKQEGVWLVGLAGEAEASLPEIDLRGPLALVLGGEEKGLRRLTREHCDYLARLPMAGTVTSLNVSVATGISLYEAVRQRTPRH